MKLPRNRDAVILDGKLAAYLLSDTHPVGKAKAKYFRSLGYSIANADQLKDDALVKSPKNTFFEICDSTISISYNGENRKFRLFTGPSNLIPS